MFESMETAPPDPILGLSEAFRNDPNPNKIDLSVGVYQDKSGHTPILASVKAAEARILKAESSKGYQPISGKAEYGAAVQALMLGEDHPIVCAGRAATAQTPGGTGALRVAADYLARKHEGTSVWLSEPTWANHPQIFAAASVPTRTYPYFEKSTNSLAFGRMIQTLQHVPAGDVVLLHGSCHNPTGVDPTPQQWEQVGDLLASRGIVPLVDFAYQGFAAGLEQDAAGLRGLGRKLSEMIICSSFSKNFGLYAERVGAVTVVGAEQAAAGAVFSHVKQCIRANYSNPPLHGAMIVLTVLNDPALRHQWEGELAAMRDRIHTMRRLFAKTLDEMGVKLSPDGGNRYLTEQNGMFSFSGLSKQHVDRLRHEHSVYIVGSGRINVAGMTTSNMGRLCEAIAGVVSASVQAAS